MSTPTYPMRRALHLRLEADLDALETAAALHGVAVDRLHSFERGEVELTPHELTDLATELALHTPWRGDPGELRELVGEDGSRYDLAGDAVQALGAVHAALAAEHERRLALAAEVAELERALPPASDPRWVHIAALWHPIGSSADFEEAAAQVARTAHADVEWFAHELTNALKAHLPT
ncbi:MAG: hypothetical protein V2J16_04315 [Thermoleophilia bacterium]|jgi:hypothetical protein|nr:hypothetical protein [Thermoleophilia bacterium]